MSEIIKVDEFKKELMGNYYKTLVNFMKSEDNAKRFMSAVVYSVQNKPKLLDCDRESLMTAFMTCAELGMYPSSASGECYVIPYGKNAQFQLGYQGVITLLYRAGIQSIKTDLIRKNDIYKYQNGELFHEIDLSKSNSERGEVIACYGIAKVNGQEIIKIMNAKDILKFKAFSKSASSDFSPWNEKNDPELHMYRKTVIKQLSKTLPKNDMFAKAIEEDNKDSKISDAKINEMSSDDVISDTLKNFEAKEGENKSIS